MARKNGKVRRANDRGRLARRTRGETRAPKNSQQPRIQIETMVIPDGKCFFRNRKGKVKFNTEAKAKAALRQAQLERSRIGSRHVENRYYECPQGGCGGYHLTSREAYDETAWKGAS